MRRAIMRWLAGVGTTWRTAEMLGGLTNRSMLYWLLKGYEGRQAYLNTVPLPKVLAVGRRMKKWKHGRWMFLWYPGRWLGWFPPGHLRIQAFGPPRFDAWYCGPLELRRHDQ